MLQLRNEFIMAPVKLGYSDGTGAVTERHMSFYSKRSKYIGAVTIEPFYMDPGLREIPTQLGIDNDDKLEGLRRLVNSIHANGAKVIAHLNHPGRMANPKIPGNYFWSSTDRACENGGAIPEKMNRDRMEKVIDLFVESAKRAVVAGFDIIEIQLGHGYLLAQFLSPAVNDRKDEYGGSFEGRKKFALDVIQAVQRSVSLPVIARISGDEMISKGYHIDEMIKFTRVLETNGIDAIHVTAGTVCSTPPWFFQHMFIPKGKTWEMADAIREVTELPVIYVGRINTKEDIDSLLIKSKAAYLAVGRSLIADPDFVGKYFGKVNGQIRPCLACAEGCLGGVKSGQGLQCLVNPEVGQESSFLKAAEQIRRFAVVGGGLAGMEAAMTLRKRGHTVDLYEKDKLGGQFNLAPLTPHKKSMEPLVPYLVGELKNMDVKVFFKEVTNSDTLAAYDGVLVATGSRPSVPKIPGLEKFYWADILFEENLPANKRVLIIGGGLIGVDIATALIPLNNQIIIVKRTTDFGEDMEMIAKNLSLKIMKEKKTIFSDHTFIKKVDGSTVYAERNDRDIQFENIDIIVVSTGMKPYNPLADILINKLVYVIGDARKTGNAQDAIRDGYDTAKSL
jgi:2,4-dienoyl-CoA reductase-like NADH-dependent reductase (Old Yellow Enzyme family)/thioredoxin reductase